MRNKWMFALMLIAVVIMMTSFASAEARDGPIQDQVQVLALDADMDLVQGVAPVVSESFSYAEYRSAWRVTAPKQASPKHNSYMKNIVADVGTYIEARAGATHIQRE